VERVVLNALAQNAAPDICAFGESSAIVLRIRRSTLIGAQERRGDQRHWLG
jgi:hypothetical protein